MLVRAVIIHGPDFFVSRAGADKVDLAFRDSGDSTAEAKDNFIRELVCRDSSRFGGRGVRILFPQHLR